MTERPPDRSLVVINALLWDGTGRDPKSGQVIEVRDGRITRVATMGADRLPHDLPVLDAEVDSSSPG